MSISETVLEMHFHQSLIDEFRKSLGLGKGKFNFYKYSPQRECFIGFDQAFVKTDLSEKELFKKLKDSSQNKGYSLSNFFVGLFLQFKVVKEMQKRSRVTPTHITTKPHFRAKLDTKKNINTGFSQHELLYNLNKNNGAFVYYACPMVFERTELYNAKPDLKKLRLADIATCPSDYSDNDSHFIYFSDSTAKPIWCSEPVEGIALTPEEAVIKIQEKITSDGFKETQINLFEKLMSSYELESNNVDSKKVKLLEILHESFVIISYEEDSLNELKEIKGVGGN